jgi:hypothetical protein
VSDVVGSRVDGYRARRTKGARRIRH